MFALLAYSFIALFAAVVAYGHVLLFRDIFSNGTSGNAKTKRIPHGMRKAA